MVPKASRVAFLGTPTDWHGPDGEAIRAAAHAMDIMLIHVEQIPRRYVDAFDLIVRNRPDALFVARNPASYGDRRAIVDFAVEHRLPSAFPYREFVEVGGLMSYGASIPDLFRRAAGYVDRILKGTKPADLPVQQPTKFELIINLRTAKALGLDVPPTLLATADGVIE